jgi:hypothetical protein
MNTIYNTKDTCPLAGCKGVGDGLLDNTYNIAFSGPHDRTGEGVAGWTSSMCVPACCACVRAPFCALCTVQCSGM